MPNIRLDLGSPVHDGQTLTFKSPADCSQVTGLKVYYPENGSTVSKTFQFADAHGNNVGSVSLFAENVLVKVILDTELNRVYVQNADTNSYLEARLDKLGIEDVNDKGCFYRKTKEGIIEWINPPLFAGEEYRTTERFNGYPVYKKLISVNLEKNEMDCSGSAKTKPVSHNITNLAELIKVSATFYDEYSNKTFQLPLILPYDNSTGFLYVARLEGSLIQIGAINLNLGVVYGKISLLLEYTKEGT